MSIRVLIAENYLPLRRALRYFLERSAGMEVVGEAADGQEAVRQCMQFKPDVVTMDVQMPGVDGIQAAGQISRLMPQVAILAISGEAALWSVDEMFAAGASGYILKEFLEEDLETALRTVACGRAFLGRMVIDKVLAHRNKDRNPVSQQETAVLRGLAQGWSREQIALYLHLAPSTLRQTLRSLCQSASTCAIARLVSHEEFE